MKNILSSFILSAMFFTANAQNIFFDFDGVNDYAGGPFPATTTVMPQGNAPRTIEAWVRPETVSNFHVIFNWGSTNPNERSALMISTGKLAFVGEFNDLSGQTTISTNTWTHVAATFDGDSIRLYVNGQLDGAKGATLNTLGNNFEVARRINGSSEFFDGQMDEIRVWNIARTQTEIQDKMNTNLTRIEPGLNNYYSLSEKYCGNTGQNTQISVENHARVLHDLTIAAISGMTIQGCSSGFVCAACGYPNIPGFVYNNLPCTPPSGTGTPGFTPEWEQFLPVVQYSYYNESFNLENVISNLVNSTTLNTITGVPTGLNITTNKGNLPISLASGEVVCINVSGITSAVPGDYKLTFGSCVNHQIAGTVCDSIDGLISTFTGMGFLPAGTDTLFEYYLTVACGNVPSIPNITGPSTANLLEIVTFSVDSFPGYTYNWTVQNGYIAGGNNYGNTKLISFDKSGTGTVTLTWSFNGCQNSSSFSVVVNCNSIPVPVIAGPDTTGENTTVSYYTEGNTDRVFDWWVTGGAITSGQGTDSISIFWGSSGIGSVSVQWLDVNNCKSDTTTLQVTIGTPSSIRDAEGRTQIAIYPNPVQQNLFVQTASAAELRVSNLLGEILIEKTLQASGIIDVSALAAGVYFIYDQQQVVVAKFIKE